METLKDVDKDRTCYRLIGGVLVQKTVGEIVPTLEHNMNQVSGNAS